LASLYQQCLKIMTCQDEDKLLPMMADTFTRELGADGCVIWLASTADPDEMLIASVRGMISIGKEGSRFFLSQSDWAEDVRKGKPFPYPRGEEGSGKGSPEREANLFVPLRFRDQPIGLVKLGPRVDRKPFSDRDDFVASIIAGYAASAWKNLARLQRMERVSLRDAETRAYSSAFLADYFEKERYKAERFRRPLSVVFFLAGNLTRLVEQTRETLVVGALSNMVEAARKALRDSDLIARIEPDRFCVVLPETDYFGSILASRRLRKAVREFHTFQYLGAEHAVEPFFVSATFPRDGKDIPSLWRTAEEKYQRQRRSVFYRMRLQGKPFWDAFDLVVGKPEFYDVLRKGESVPYFAQFKRDLGRNGHFRLGRETFRRMVESVARDVASLDRKRGLVIVAGPRPEMYKQIFLSAGPSGGNGRNIYIIGRAGSTRFDAKNLLYVSAQDDRLAEREIVLYLKESGAYGLFAAERQDEVCGFNTADEWLVDSMVEKVQETYRLQGNF
ncbi:MAG TPA: diguanylate cyclase, partial [Candidatus Aquicultoraceae bacterium]|nr:diguanylate cyclase [Candidatus Aquicultoraceae bacterium]